MTAVERAPPLQQSNESHLSSSAMVGSPLPHRRRTSPQQNAVLARPPRRPITRMGCHRPRQPGCQPLYMGRTAAGNNRLMDGPAPRPSERAQ
jgi:hypothetical protein